MVGQAASHACAADSSTDAYQRRRPERSALYRVIDEHADPVFADARERTEHGYGYPRFVEREFEKFLDCGILARGFVRVRCWGCSVERLVAFSCKGRGFCPSCTTRRMTCAAARLTERVFPHVPYRQWVLSFPRRVRFALACDPELLTRALNIFVRKLFAWQRRQARALGVHGAHGGAVSFVQRFGSLLNLNCHFHCVVPDGVFVPTRSGEVEFISLPPPWDDDVQRILEQTARAVEKHLARRQADELPEMALMHHQQSASVQAGRRLTRRAPATGRTKRRCAFVAGYSLHADRTIDADDRSGLERLCRYAARSPIANSRLSVDESGRVRLALRRPLRDGRTELVFAPDEFVRRLATLVPPPKRHLTRYQGVFAPNHHLRSQVIPNQPQPTDESEPTSEPPVRKRSHRLDWAELLRRVFAIDVLSCPRCHRPMTIIAVLDESDVTDAILAHLGIDDPRSTGPPAPMG